MCASSRELGIALGNSLKYMQIAESEGPGTKRKPRGKHPTQLQGFCAWLCRTRGRAIRWNQGSWAHSLSQLAEGQPGYWPRSFRKVLCSTHPTHSLYSMSSALQFSWDTELSSGLLELHLHRTACLSWKELEHCPGQRLLVFPTLNHPMYDLLILYYTNISIA